MTGRGRGISAPLARQLSRPRFLSAFASLASPAPLTLTAVETLLPCLDRSETVILPPVLFREPLATFTFTPTAFGNLARAKAASRVILTILDPHTELWSMFIYSKNGNRLEYHTLEDAAEEDMDAAAVEWEEWLSLSEALVTYPTKLGVSCHIFNHSFDEAY